MVIASQRLRDYHEFKRVVMLVRINKRNGSEICYFEFGVCGISFSNVLVVFTRFLMATHQAAALQFPPGQHRAEGHTLFQFCEGQINSFFYVITPQLIEGFGYTLAMVRINPYIILAPRGNLRSLPDS